MQSTITQRKELGSPMWTHANDTQLLFKQPVSCRLFHWLYKLQVAVLKHLEWTHVADQLWGQCWQLQARNRWRSLATVVSPPAHQHRSGSRLLHRAAENTTWPSALHRCQCSTGTWRTPPERHSHTALTTIFQVNLHLNLHSSKHYVSKLEKKTCSTH